MLSPEYLKSVSDYLVHLYDKLEEDIIRDIVRRLVKTGEVTETAQWQYQQLQHMGALQDEILQKVAEYANKTEDEIREKFTEAMELNIETNAAPLVAHGVEVEMRMSPQQRQILEGMVEWTQGNIRNITLTTGVAGSSLYYECSNEAYMRVISGAYSHADAVYKAVKKAGWSGANVQYEKRRDKLDVAIRRNIMTSLGQTTARITEMNAADLGAEYYETSAHSGARPSHAVWQGRVFKIEGSTPEYPNFADSTHYGDIGGICGVNCRHSFYPFFPGISKPAYSRDTLDRYANHKVTYNGKQYSDYDASQKQRELERGIRAQKRILAGIDEARKAAGDEELEKKLKDEFEKESTLLKLKEMNLRDFLNQTGRDAENERVRVPEFNKSVSMKAVWADRNRNRIELLANNSKSDTIKIEDTTIFRTLSARAKNYDVEDKGTGSIYKFVEGTKIQNSEVFAGYKTRHPLNEEVAKGLAEQIGGAPEKWQHCKGIGVLDVDGEYVKAEVHWFQEESVGKHKFKVKVWLDDES